MAFQDIAKIGVIGAGVSGTLVVINLIRQSKGPLIIEWFERTGNFGPGIAYNTHDKNHLLNVRTSSMGAFADNPKDFYEWLLTFDGVKAIQKICPDYIVDTQSFAPRALYGSYIKCRLQEGLDLAERKGIEINFHSCTVVDAYYSIHEQNSYLISSETSNNLIKVDCFVLSTGNEKPRSIIKASSGDTLYSPFLIEDVWNFIDSIDNLEKIKNLSCDTTIAVIGTGLTMVDIVLTLSRIGYKGKIVALSRNGLLPLPHCEYSPYPSWDWIVNTENVPLKAIQFLQILKGEINKATKRGYDWRSVIDSLRPVTQNIWRRFDENEKRKILQHLLPFWNIHRHRMSPDIYEKIQSLINSNKLDIISTQCFESEIQNNGISLIIAHRGSSKTEKILSSFVFNCIGPNYSISNTQNLLIRNLLKNRLIEEDITGLGIRLTLNGLAHNVYNAPIYPIGSLLIGELLECTAVPDLRFYAQDMAKKIISFISEKKDRRGFYSIEDNTIAPDRLVKLS